MHFTTANIPPILQEIEQYPILGVVLVGVFHRHQIECLFRPPMVVDHISWLKRTKKTTTNNQQ